MNRSASEPQASGELKGKANGGPPIIDNTRRVAIGPVAKQLSGRRSHKSNLLPRVAAVAAMLVCGVMVYFAIHHVTSTFNAQSINLPVEDKSEPVFEVDPSARADAQVDTVIELVGAFEDVASEISPLELPRESRSTTMIGVYSPTKEQTEAFLTKINAPPDLEDSLAELVANHRATSGYGEAADQADAKRSSKSAQNASLEASIPDASIVDKTSQTDVNAEFATALSDEFSDGVDLGTEFGLPELQNIETRHEGPATVVSTESDSEAPVTTLAESSSYLGLRQRKLLAPPLDASVDIVPVPKEEASKEVASNEEEASTSVHGSSAEVVTSIEGATNTEEGTNSEVGIAEDSSNKTLPDHVANNRIAATPEENSPAPATPVVQQQSETLTLEHDEVLAAAYAKYQLVFEAWQRKPDRKTSRAYYAAIAVLAEKLHTTEDIALLTTICEELTEIYEDKERFQLLSAATPSWIRWDKRKSPGVVVAGKLESVTQHPAGLQLALRASDRHKSLVLVVIPDNDATIDMESAQAVVIAGVVSTVEELAERPSESLVGPVLGFLIKAH